MIKLILDFLDEQLVNWPVNLLGLAEMHIKSVKESDIVYPLIYKGKSKYDAVNEKKNLVGFIYHRNTGFSEEDVERGTGVPRIKRSYQLITVAMVRKNLTKDNVFSASEIGERLATQIASDFFDHPNLLSRVVVNDTIYNSLDVHALEFIGIDLFVPSDMVMIRVNWTATYQADITCFPTIELC